MAKYTLKLRLCKILATSTDFIVCRKTLKSLKIRHYTLGSRIDALKLTSVLDQLQVTCSNLKLYGQGTCQEENQNIL